MTHLSFDGDDNNKTPAGQNPLYGPARPDELQVPQGLGPILGSGHDEEVNRQML